ATASQNPFFVWLHLYDAHDPYTSPEPYASRHAGHPYDGAVTFLDANVGTLIEWLKQKGLFEKSLVVVVADHGEGLGDHGEETHGFFIYNASLHVPFLIRFPS